MFVCAVLFFRDGIQMLDRKAGSKVPSNQSILIKQDYKLQGPNQATIVKSHEEQQFWVNNCKRYNII